MNKASVILQEVLGTDAMIATNSQDHLGTYGAALENIPGISTKYGNAFDGGLLYQTSSHQ